MPTKSRLRLSLIGLLMLICSSIAFAKSIPSIEKINQVSDLFMSQAAAGDTESALNLVAAYLGVDSTQFEQRATKIVIDMKRIEAGAGKALSYAKLDEQRIGEHFYKVRYLLKYQQAALVWELNFYQPQQGWYLVDVNFNTNIDALFE